MIIDMGGVAGAGGGSPRVPYRRPPRISRPEAQSRNTGGPRASNALQLMRVPHALRSRSSGSSSTGSHGQQPWRVSGGWRSIGWKRRMASAVADSVLTIRAHEHCMAVPVTQWE